MSCSVATWWWLMFPHHCLMPTLLQGLPAANSPRGDWGVTEREGRFFISTMGRPIYNVIWCGFMLHYCGLRYLWPTEFICKAAAAVKMHAATYLLTSNSRTFLQTSDLSFQCLPLHIHISFLILHLVELLLDGFSHLCLFGNLLTHLIHLLFSHLTGGRGGVEALHRSSEDGKGFWKRRVDNRCYFMTYYSFTHLQFFYISCSIRLRFT